VATGQRLLDYFTLHVYPDAGEYSDDVSQATELLRKPLDAHLWDPNYPDEGGSAAPTPRHRGEPHQPDEGLGEQLLPGTKIGINRVQLGRRGNINGDTTGQHERATTQADIWGILARRAGPGQPLEDSRYRARPPTWP